jgi:rSAM/selenodomain-associated transferase 1
VFELDWRGGDVAAVCTDDPAESAWYDAYVARIDVESGTAERLHEAEWQLQCPRISPGGRIAWIEGFASDRRVVTGTIHVDEVGPLAPRALPVVAQQGADLGARMHHAVEHLIVARNCSAGILIGTDIPLLTAAHIDDAASALRSGSELVLGPAADGGYYLIGVTRVIDEVFEAIEWGTNRVLSQTIAIARRVGITARTIATLYDVDTIDDLRRAERDLRAAPPAIAPALRDFMATFA